MVYTKEGAIVYAMINLLMLIVILNLKIYYTFAFYKAVGSQASILIKG